MKEYLIGLMSGTSMDSLDAVLVQFESGARPRVLEKNTTPLPSAVREALFDLEQPGNNELDRTAQLDSVIARLFAEAVKILLDKAAFPAKQVRAIGSHGQTIRHKPEGPEPYTIQLGNPSLLAELTAIPVVADFRRRDVAAGGQGAPLAPAFHAAFFRHSSEPRVVLNLGGIGNITILPPSSSSGPIGGFDTGPGNTLLDNWIQRHRGLTMDQDGTWAEQGRSIQALLECCLADPFFSMQPPKSTGREYFNLDWLLAKLASLSLDKLPAAQDVQSTLVELTTCSVSMAIEHYAPDAARILVSGGGAHNGALMRSLQNRCPGLPVESTAEHGIDPDYVEAIGFAWLAKQTLDGSPGNLPAVTGARGPRILGGVYAAYR